jgi:hypothetical protein
VSITIRLAPVETHCSRFESAPSRRSAKSHREDLSPEAVDRAEGLQKSLSHSWDPIRSIGLIGSGELVVDPGHQVAPALVPQKEEEGVRGLVQAAFAQGVSGEGAGLEVLGMGTGAAGLAVVAPGECLEVRELGAGRAALKGSVDLGPPHPTMRLKIGPGDGVGDPLIVRDID